MDTIHTDHDVSIDRDNCLMQRMKIVSLYHQFHVHGNDNLNVYALLQMHMIHILLIQMLIYDLLFGHLIHILCELVSLQIQHNIHLIDHIVDLEDILNVNSIEYLNLHCIDEELNNLMVISVQLLFR